MDEWSYSCTYGITLEETLSELNSLELGVILSKIKDLHFTGVEKGFLKMVNILSNGTSAI